MKPYSSLDFYRDWRYDVEKEFITTNGQPFPYAVRHGEQEWGDEAAAISVQGGTELFLNGSMSGDGSRLAVSVGRDIQIIDTKTLQTICVLEGHGSPVTAMAFHPLDANMLVSGDEPDDDQTGPEIIVWQVYQVVEDPDIAIAEPEASKGQRSTAQTTGAGGQNGPDAKLVEAQPDMIKKAALKYNAVDLMHIHGRLQTRFQSQAFSPSGSWMVYLPGNSPGHNGADAWDIAIRRVDNEAVDGMLTLRGHSDAVSWVGWSPDELCFGSVSWDQTIRIWNAVTGDQIFMFRTPGQNWTGAFSPDSNLFAATCGTGSVSIYSLAEAGGSVRWLFEDKAGKCWKRALDWHTNCKWLAAGCEKGGRLLVVDVERQVILQERVLSGNASKPDDEATRELIRDWPEVSQVKFLQDGQKLAAWTDEDGSIEVYDLEEQVKWRFARGGTGNRPQSSKWRDEQGKVVTRAGHGMLAWIEPTAKERLRFASLDPDMVRIWSLEL